MIRARRMLVLVIGLLAAVDGLAASPKGRHAPVRVPAPLAVWLRAIDATPTAAQLARSDRRAARTLDRVARDPHSRKILRHRAIALLAILTGPRAEKRLRGLLKTRRTAIRASAAVAWASGPGRRHPARASRTMRRVLADRDPVVRRAAARALVLFGDGALARGLAVQRRGVERDGSVKAALDASIRRLDRAPRRRAPTPK